MGSERNAILRNSTETACLLLLSSSPSVCDNLHFFQVLSRVAETEQHLRLTTDLFNSLFRYNFILCIGSFCCKDFCLFLNILLANVTLPNSPFSSCQILEFILPNSGKSTCQKQSILVNRLTALPDFHFMPVQFPVCGGLISRGWRSMSLFGTA